DAQLRAVAARRAQHGVRRSLLAVREPARPGGPVVLGGRHRAVHDVLAPALRHRRRHRLAPGRGRRALGVLQMHQIVSPTPAAAGGGRGALATSRAHGPSEPGMTRVRSSPRIEGHQYFSICSTTSSVPRAWLTYGGWRGSYIASVRSRA